MNQDLEILFQLTAQEKLKLATLYVAFMRERVMQMPDDYPLPEKAGNAVAECQILAFSFVMLMDGLAPSKGIRDKVMETASLLKEPTDEERSALAADFARSFGSSVIVADKLLAAAMALTVATVNGDDAPTITYTAIEVVTGMVATILIEIRNEDAEQAKKDANVCNN